MDRAIRHEFGLSRAKKLIIAIGLLCFFGVSVFVYCFLYSNIKIIVSNQAINSITNISQLNEDSVSRSIANRRTLLEMMSFRLSAREVKDVETILREIEDFRVYYDFYSMGLLDENETLYLTNGHVLDVSGIPQYKTAWDDAFHITESYLPADGGSYAVNTFSCPIYYNDVRKYVLIATYRSKNLTERMNVSAMGEQAYTFILNSEGGVAIYPKNYEDEAYVGLMEYINSTPDIIPDRSGDTYFTYEGERYYAHFEPMEINDWHLMTCAKESDVFAEANLMIQYVSAGLGLLWMLIVAAVLAIVYSVRNSRKEIRQAVFYDELLGIGNGNFLPVYFRKLPEKVCDQLAVVSFDTDKFKEFNYIYGDECGDELLKYIVRVFQKELPQDLLFRYMADHFVALLHSADKEELARRMEKVLRRFAKDIDAGRIQPFDISAGIRIVRPHDQFRRVMSEAMIAKGTIKGIQLQQFAFYDDSMLQHRMSYMEMESDFSRALKAGEFQVYYQPKYEMETGAIIGAEALVRWIRPDGMVIMPDAFIPCFEASRQIILLDEAMLQSVCRQMRQMEEDGLEVRRVSVNLSRVHLRHPGILDKIERIIQSAGVDPKLLSFEITESALYEDNIPLKNIVDSLHALGCKVEMDDYGVGVSGPNSLASNRFDVVKMDRSFVSAIGEERMEAVIKSTIALAKTLGIEILAEGVEEKHQAELLLSWGCTLAQGFYFSRPVPEDEYRKLLGTTQP